MSELNDQTIALVVDDSEVMREMITDILKGGGFKVIKEARNGDEALERYKQHHPAIVTMDVVMPSKHGIDAIKTIMEYDPKARIIVVSGLHQKNLVMNALEAGARDYIIKPFEPDDLLATLMRNMA